ncbi:MAG: gamma-butyrobetaine dioxygenase [Acidimicrobiaceae bacterium]|nr:gamma-butyrobetaine dioxygenase [Acidimicrobiaceae bacterium]
MEPEEREALPAPYDLPTGDFYLYPITAEIVTAKITERTIRVNWNNEETSDFHFFWLRDNCPCCVHPYTLEQTFEIVNAPENLRPSQVEVTPEGALVVQWQPEEHKSVFHPGWLKEHCYSSKKSLGLNQQIEMWESSTREKPDEYNWSNICDDENIELQWLQSIQTTGCALIHAVPLEDPAVGEVANRIGVMRHSNFGDLFDVQVDFDPVSNSNTGLELPPHTDLPTREYQPGMQLLHCLVNDVQGGNSILVDGFRVAEEIREKHPKSYELLTTISWDFANRSRTSDYRWKAPMIGLDQAGEYSEIRAGSWLRYPLQAPPELMEDMYEAYRIFETTSHDPQFQIKFRLEAGDCMIFDNRRVLHGRTAFEAKSGKRHLRGCYIDRDELRSRIRLLEGNKCRKLILSEIEK